MFCGKCGTENEESFKFCKKCGADIGDLCNGISSDMNIFELKEEDTQQDVENKLISQEILNFIPLREGEEILAVTTSNNIAVTKYINIKKILIGILYFLIFVFIHFLAIYFYQYVELQSASWGRSHENIMKEFSIYMLITGIIICLTSIFLFVKMKCKANLDQILIVTNQRLLGRSCGPVDEFKNNKTLFGLELSNHYTETKSTCFGKVLYTINVGGEKISFYALKNLDKILSKISEARNYI